MEVLCCGALGASRERRFENRPIAPQLLRHALRIHIPGVFDQDLRRSDREAGADEREIYLLVNRMDVTDLRPPREQADDRIANAVPGRILVILNQLERL